MQRLVLNMNDEELLDRLESQAKRRGTPLHNLVLEALEWWVEAIDVAQDLAHTETTVAEYKLEGGIDAFEYFRERAREGDLQG